MPPIWDNPGETNVIQFGDVHIWRMRLDQSMSQLLRLEQILSTDERKRADQFHFERHRRRFLVGRWFLRSVLGRYVNSEPSQLRFFYSDRGKPFLKAPHNHSVGFNLSHSHEMALCAVTLNQAVGIDVEYIRPIPEGEQLAQRLFTSQEYKIIRSVSPERRQRMFFNLWTVKESYLKATGEGLAGLDTVEIRLSPDLRKITLEIDGERQPSQWSVYPFTPEYEYTAALVAEGRECNLRYFDWDGRALLLQKSFF
jgi:4'-phosphopantetheinyl transferase